MTITKVHCLTLALLVTIGISILGEHKVSAECQVSLPDLAAKCQKFVQISGPKIPPSQECCQLIKNVDVQCICKLITREIEKIISMEKVVYVARTCGVIVQPGTKCGSYTVPPLV